MFRLSIRPTVPVDTKACNSSTCIMHIHTNTGLNCMSTAINNWHCAMRWWHLSSMQQESSPDASSATGALRCAIAASRTTCVCVCVHVYVCSQFIRICVCVCVLTNRGYVFNDGMYMYTCMLSHMLIEGAFISRRQTTTDHRRTIVETFFLRIA